ncbi:MAG TPA: multidrug efflux RND transporter permease subunit [Terriglobales bacterium]|nr:multidrug efflux RND transporter permease subunit [Terriglobales bacterium]
MSVSSPFIKRPVGTSLLTVGVLLAGILAFQFLPVAPLPQVEFPVISVSASLPGASPETMASAVATPLERQFGRIAGISQMTSTSQIGSTNISLQFDLDRNIDAAGRDVQAAINAARSQLPSYLPGNPSYRKVNPADAPVLILSLTSDTMTLPQMYDAGDSILSQKLAQVSGVGQVFVGGAARPAVRAEVNPNLLNKIGLGLDVVRTALNGANANLAKGSVSNAINAWAITDNDQIKAASQYKPLVIAYNNGSTVRLSDVANVQDSVENTQVIGLAGSSSDPVKEGKPAVLIIIFRQPGANIIQTVDNVYALLPELSASISPAIHVNPVMDRTTTIRASVRDIEITLLISVVLVILVVFAFLRTVRATIIPSIAVPLSLIGTFGVMYACGYSLDNLSLMALAVSTGFVVDDAIVVLENITRHLEAGMSPVAAAFRGAREIGFTVLSMSTSLVAVFIPILLMGGIVGRLFREFAVTLSAAIGVSLLISLSTTPMMCAQILRPPKEEKHNWLYRSFQWVFDLLLKIYRAMLTWVMRHQPLTLGVTILTAALTIFLYTKIPTGFFPQQDTGRVMGSVQADQDISFAAMKQKMEQFVSIVMKDSNVQTIVGFAGGNTAKNQGRMFITLKPKGKERKITADQFIGEMRRKLAVVPGATLFMQSAQDLTIGGRMGNAQYQYTLQGENLKELSEWAPKLLGKLKTLKELRDPNADQQDRGLDAEVIIDRDTASRLGISPQNIDSALYDAFGQRQVSTIYRQLNQYHVVMEVDPQYQNSPAALDSVYVRSSNGQMVPLSAIANFGKANTALAVNHQGQFPSITISFNLAPNISLGQATQAIDAAEREIQMPATIHASFQGTAAAYQQVLANQPILIGTALLTVYIVLGILYESYIHPITILSTLPSAGLGALLALLITGRELNVMGLIGIILLIGIVKKNAIMMIDFALDAERREGKSPQDAIFEACMLRFRPIMMTTMAALLGGLPLAVGTGVGSELRQPLGITIVGGLILSQALTLFTTPVVYLYMDRLRWMLSRKGRPVSGEISPAGSQAD